MSKRSREERKKRAELQAGNANVSAPLVRPELPRPNLVQSQVGADLAVVEQRPAWFTRGELRGLISLIESVNTQHRLLPHLKQVLVQFDDAALKRREVEAAAVAVGFWLEGEAANVNGLIGKLKKGRKKGHRKLEKNIKCVSAAKMKKLLKDVGKEEANGAAPPPTPPQ